MFRKPKSIVGKKSSAANAQSHEGVTSLPSGSQGGSKALGVLPMLRVLALILACGASLISFSVQASPILVASGHKAAPDFMLVRDFCGLGFHRGPYGYCMRNGSVPVPPVIMTPSPGGVAASPGV